MTHFAVHFRDHVTPILRSTVKSQALAVAVGSIEFSDAVAAVWAVARSRGATFLSDGVVDELRDWILTNLSSEVNDALAACPEQLDLIETADEPDEEWKARYVVDLERLTDPVGHYERLASGCRETEIIRWVFAAISPEYRAHLLAVRRGA